MDITFGVSRHIKIDDQSDVFHIQSSRSDISSHQNTSFSRFESVEHSLSFSLSHISVEKSCFEPISEKYLMYCLGISFGMGKNKYFVFCMSPKKFDDIIQFFFMFYGKISMMNLVHGNAFTYFDEFIGGDMFLDDSFHLIIHSCRKCIGLFDVLKLCSNFFNITDKSHIQHPIDLIKNEVFSDTDIDDFLIHKIHKPAWRSDNDSGIPFEMIFLNVRTRSPIKTSESHSIIFSKIPYLFTYLNDKFSRRSKNQYL